MSGTKQGVFKLRNHHELMAKLERDYSDLVDEPWNSDTAYNFFVTGWHMLEWAYPGDEPRHQSVRDKNICLQISRNIALGAKHFDLTTKHKTVEETGLDGGAWAEGVWAEDTWDPRAWGQKLYVDLLPEAEAKLKCKRISAVDLAAKVIEFWRKNLPD